MGVDWPSGGVHRDSAEAVPKAKAAALKAIALDDTSAGAHNVRATVRSGDELDWAPPSRRGRAPSSWTPTRRPRGRTSRFYLKMLGRPRRRFRTSSAPSSWTRSTCCITASTRGSCAPRGVTTMRGGIAHRDGQRHARRGGACRRGDGVRVHRERDGPGAPGSAAGADRGRPGAPGGARAGLREGGYQGAMRRVAESLAAPYKQSEGCPDLKAPGLASQPPAIIVARDAHGGDYGRAIDWLEKSFQVGGGDLSIASHPRRTPCVGTRVFRRSSAALACRGRTGVPPVPTGKRDACPTGCRRSPA